MANRLHLYSRRRDAILRAKELRKLNAAVPAVVSIPVAEVKAPQRAKKKR